MASPCPRPPRCSRGVPCLLALAVAACGVGGAGAGGSGVAVADLPGAGTGGTAPPTVTPAARGGRPLPGARGAGLAAERARDPTVAASALDDDDGAVAALASLARIGTAPALAAAVPRLDGPAVPAPETIAAFGLFDPDGFVAGDATVAPLLDRAERALWSHHVLADDPATRSATAFALARVGRARTARLVIQALAPAPNDPAFDPARAAVDLRLVEIACRRGIGDAPALVDAAAQALDAGDPSVRRAALAAIARCVPRLGAAAADRAEVLSPRIERARAGADASVAAAAYAALAALGDAPASRAVFEPFDGPEDPSVPGWVVVVRRVEALAAGGAAGRRRLAAALDDLDPATLSFPAAHAVAVALAALRTPVEGDGPAVEAAARLAERLAASPGPPGRARRERMTIACLAATTAAARGRAVEAAACEDDALPPAFARRQAVERWRSAAPGPARTKALLAFAADEDPTVAAFALGGLIDAGEARVRATVLAALRRDDPGVAAAAASVVGRWLHTRPAQDRAIVDALLDVAAPAPGDPRASAPWIEARLSAIDALDALLHAPPAQRRFAEAIVRRLSARTDEPHHAVRLAIRRALARHPDAVEKLAAAWAAAPGARAFEKAGGRIDPPPSMPARPRLRFDTDAGAFEVVLYGDLAPMNVTNLLSLAAGGFFDGLTFHRVVPGFVVQGGDPRGDGYGGPGYVVPCEWSNLAYDRGTVGIALAGKDTGGSQFFVTHVPAPHLEGRYTVVGRVTAGMDVVDRLLPYDRIARVVVLDGP